jgi:murein DD-endopeptidase MepM/ murein hydrolase activator NlpD
MRGFGGWKRFLAVLMTAVLVVSFYPDVIKAATVEELREELRQRRETLKEAEERINKFKDDIQLKKKEARTLEQQIGIIDDNIEEVSLSIQRTLAEVEDVHAEIQLVEEEIKEREAEIELQKTRLAAYIRSMHELDQQSSVSVFLKYDTFSDAVNEAATFEEMHGRGQKTLIAIQQLRDELNTKKRDLEDFKQTLESLQKRQEKEQMTLNSQKNSKARILELTNEQEKQYQDLLKQAQSTHEAAQEEIASLDTLIREELKKQGVGELPGVGIMDWPVVPEFGVSCEFHCAGYPYAYLIGPHTGTDIPAYVGTPVKAPSDGYVAKVHDSGGPGYSYVMLLHGGNISTVFGHLSGFAVNEGQMVSRGTVIGYTGGAPGMRGSGLSTGPHLHFEVRENNRPVNARKYL